MKQTERRGFTLILIVAVLVPSRLALAGNAAPLGVEIGVATADQVREQLGKMTELRDAGTNQYSGGKMLTGSGEGLDVAGLKKITFVFDQAGVLQATLMTMDKDFQAAYQRLRKKYKVTSQRIPFVGDSSARFVQQDSVILLEAPHLSFEMTLSYLSQRFLATVQARSAAESSRREREQQGRL